MKNLTLVLFVFVTVFAVSHVLLRKILRRVGYDQWVYRRCYERDKFWMSKGERKHMRGKFGVAD